MGQKIKAQKSPELSPIYRSAKKRSFEGKNVGFEGEIRSVQIIKAVLFSSKYK
jgi:hypothetical protein